MRYINMRLSIIKISRIPVITCTWGKNVANTNLRVEAYKSLLFLLLVMINEGVRLVNNTKKMYK